jgi:hypothetical protein
MRYLRILIALSAAVLVQSALPPPAHAHAPEEPPKPVAWKVVDSVDFAAFNKDVVPGKPTVDVGVYLPSNFDPAFNKVTLEKLLDGVRSAKEIYGRAGVQINLLWVKTGAIDPKYLAIQSNEIPRIPDTEYLNPYEANVRHPSQLTDMARSAFQSIVEPNKDNTRTIYLVALQDVIFPFVEVAGGRNWTIKMVRTGGLSFPTYTYYRTIPPEFRGVITITNLSTPSRLRPQGHECEPRVQDHKSRARGFRRRGIDAVRGGRRHSIRCRGPLAL